MKKLILLLTVLFSVLIQGCNDQGKSAVPKNAELDLNRSGTKIGVPEGAAAMTVGEKKYPNGKIIYFNSLSEGEMQK